MARSVRMRVRSARKINDSASGASFKSRNFAVKSPKTRLYRHSKDRYQALGVEWGSSSVKTSGASCDEIIMANEHRKSLMSLV
jgi:hypothetical protein